MAMLRLSEELNTFTNNSYQYRPESRIFGYNFSDESQHELLETVISVPEQGQGTRLIVTANLDHIVRLRTDTSLQNAYRSAWRRTLDGFPVFLYAKIRGAKAPGRITGADLFPQIMSRLKAGLHRPCFLVASPDISRKLQTWLGARGFTPEEVSFCVAPMHFDPYSAEADQIARHVRAHRTTHLFLGIGCPKSEIWVDVHRRSLGDCYAFSFGAALAFFVGTTRRAPGALRQLGFEWLWRVSQEPGRLGQRYFVNSWKFWIAIYEDMKSEYQRKKLARLSRVATAAWPQPTDDYRGYPP